MSLDGLGARERQLMEIVYRLGRASVREVLRELPDPLHYSTVRTMLNKLESKGRLHHVEEGRRYVYVPTTPLRETQRSTLRRVVSNLFDGSTGRAMAALLDLDDDLDPDELEALEARIDALRSRGE